MAKRPLSHRVGAYKGQASHKKKAPNGLTTRQVRRTVKKLSKHGLRGKR